MIKKAVLLTLTTPFLMVFSLPAFSKTLVNTHTELCRPENSGCISGWVSQYSSAISSALAKDTAKAPEDVCFGYNRRLSQEPWGTEYVGVSAYLERTSSIACGPGDPPIPDGYAMSDAQCKRNMGDTLTASASVANYLNSGGSAGAIGGACSFSGGSGVTACTGDPVECSIPIEAESANEVSDYSKEGESIGEGDGTFSVIEFNTPEYLNELPGGCSDNSSCVTIGDTSYLVDWESAPDHFSYVDSNGTTHSKNSSGGGGGGSGGDNGGGDNGGGDPTDPTNPTDPTDPGGDNGGGDDSGNDDSDDNNGGGGSGGGSTVPDFEFDESGIIEAIRSSGQSNRNSIDALSNDVTREISDQTNDLNAATSAQTEALTNTINSQTSELVTQGDRQTGRVTTAITSQTQSVQNTLDNQTRSLNSTLEGLEKSLVDAFKNITVRFSGGGSGGGSSGGSDGDGEGDGEGEGEGDGIDGLFDSLVDKLASRFTEDLGDGDGLFDSSGMDETLDGVAVQEQEHGDEINSLMDEVGDGASSDIAEQITSRLPSLPSGGCVPFQFGPMEISCRPFNIIKSWLTWAIYFYSVISIINTFFRSEQRTA